jgi:hypothetical protein
VGILDVVAWRLKSGVRIGWDVILICHRLDDSFRQLIGHGFEV